MDIRHAGVIETQYNVSLRQRVLAAAGITSLALSAYLAAAPEAASAAITGVTVDASCGSPNNFMDITNNRAANAVITVSGFDTDTGTFDFIDQRNYTPGQHTTIDIADKYDQVTAEDATNGTDNETIDYASLCGNTHPSTTTTSPNTTTTTKPTTTTSSSPTTSTTQPTTTSSSSTSSSTTSTTLMNPTTSTTEQIQPTTTTTRKPVTTTEQPTTTPRNNSIETNNLVTAKTTTTQAVAQLVIGRDPEQTLPNTGSESAYLLEIGSGLLIASLLTSRRRRYSRSIN